MFEAFLFSPSVSAVGIATHIVQCHFVFGLARVSLKENSFGVLAFGTRMVSRSWQCWIGDHVGDYLGQLVHFVSDLVYVDAWVVGELLVVTVSALSISLKVN